MQVDRRLMEGCAAAERLLERTTPDALIVGTDMMVPEILPVLEAHRLQIPIIGYNRLKAEFRP